MQFLMATAGLSVPSIRSSIGFTTWFCAEHLHHSIAKSVNESPYKSSLLKRSSSDSSSAPGKIPSSFLREMDIINGFQLCDRSYRDVSLRGSCRSPSLFSPDDGSTVVSVFLHKTRRQLITAHVGDARAALISLHDSFNLTADHKPSNPSEKERVELLGGRIINYGVLRVQGVLAVTRALGDFSLRPFVSNVPTVSCFALQGDECFVVLASDGLW